MDIGDIVKYEVKIKPGISRIEHGMILSVDISASESGRPFYEVVRFDGGFHDFGYDEDFTSINAADPQGLADRGKEISK